MKQVNRRITGALLAAFSIGANCFVPFVSAQSPAFPAKSQIYHDTWTDFNKNGKKDVYEDSHADIHARVEDLLRQMNLDEKTCQTGTLYGFNRVLTDPLPTTEWKTRIWKDGIANIDEHANGVGKGSTSMYATDIKKH